MQNWLIDEISRHLAVFNANLLAEVDSQRTDATGLSLWLAANLPFNDQLKLQLLGMQSPVKRLRCELSFLAKVCRKFILIYFYYCEPFKYLTVLCNMFIICKIIVVISAGNNLIIFNKVFPK